MCGSSDDGRKKGMFSGSVEASAAFEVDIVTSGKGSVCEISKATWGV